MAPCCGSIALWRHTSCQISGAIFDRGRTLGKRGGCQIATDAEPIERAILSIRGQRVMLDADLASLYSVTTKRLNEQVKRNRERFPADFMFRLTARAKSEVVANCDHLARLRF